MDKSAIYPMVPHFGTLQPLNEHARKKFCPRPCTIQSKLFGGWVVKTACFKVEPMDKSAIYPIVEKICLRNQEIHFLTKVSLSDTFQQKCQ